MEDLSLKMPPWVVTSVGDFWPQNPRERSGRQLPFFGEFEWAGSHWVVPGVYACTKALVVDFCRRVDPQAQAAFRAKWEEDPDAISRLGLERRKAESPLNFAFTPAALADGRELSMSQGSGVVYDPTQVGAVNEVEGFGVVRHYSLDETQVWQIWRYAFPWDRQPKSWQFWKRIFPGRKVASLSLRLKPHPSQVPGKTFQVHQPGERVPLQNPVIGETATLTVVDFQPQTMDEFFRARGLEGWEFPNHLWRLTYTLEPELEGFTLRDTANGDQMRPTSSATVRGRAALGTEVSPATSVAIIGGADGPVALYRKGGDSHREAFSSPHFQPVDSVTWLPLFRQERGPSITVELAKTNG